MHRREPLPGVQVTVPRRPPRPTHSPAHASRRGRDPRSTGHRTPCVRGPRRTARRPRNRLPRPSPRSRQRRTAVGALTDSPWFAQRHPDRRADDAHVALKIPQHHLVEGQALAFQPAKVATSRQAYVRRVPEPSCTRRKRSASGALSLLARRSSRTADRHVAESAGPEGLRPLLAVPHVLRADVRTGRTSLIRSVNIGTRSTAPSRWCGTRTVVNADVSLSTSSMSLPATTAAGRGSESSSVDPNAPSRYRTVCGRVRGSYARYTMD